MCPCHISLSPSLSPSLPPSLPPSAALEQQKCELDLAGEEQLKWRLQKQAHDFEQELKEKVT